jgi:hypothetical protein
VKYRVTRIVANANVAGGVLIVIAGAALAGVTIWNPSFAAPGLGRLGHEPLWLRVAFALMVFGIGVLVGTAFIVGGQLVLVFLEMRSRLARIDRRLRRQSNNVAEELRRRL